MKKIQYFKLFESRTAELSDEEFLNLVKTKCRDFINNPKYLQRLKTSFNGEYSYINPKLSHRNPLMKEDSGGVFSSHHTLLMDNLPSWKKFPKRTQSIIGSTNFSFDPAFGDHYYFIIPYDNATFALAPGSDLWASNCVISLKSGGNPYYYQFDDYFSECFTQAGISDDTYEEMMNDIQKLFDDYSNNSKILVDSHIIRIFDKMIEDNIKDVKIGLDECFGPSKFKAKNHTGFSLMNYSEISSIEEINSDGKLSKVSREFWTDSECLLVYLGKEASPGPIYDRFKSILDLFS